MNPNEQRRSVEMKFASGIEKAVFSAAVRFHRTQSVLKRAKGFEEEQDLSVMPTMTWWWYEVRLMPDALIAGTWNLSDDIVLDCRSDLATSADTLWVGVIVRDQAQINKWLWDFKIHDGKVVDRDTGEPAAAEAQSKDFIVEYCRKHGLKP
jgi:hypothetical protein